MNFAFAGLRHPHILALYRALVSHPEHHVVGAWEEDAAAAAEAASIIHEPFYPSYEALLSDPRVDVVAIGDYYGVRGARIAQALRAGRPVLADKPICTSLPELETIAGLSRIHGCPVGCLLDLREDAALNQAAALIQAGRIGSIRAVHFTGQHPLNYGVRPGWYFEPGKHGGTFNDLSIHGLDAVQWITGSAYGRTLYARQWNAYATAVPSFLDSAHFSGLLENGAALTADVSYSAPSPSAFLLPSYWRFTFWGTEGFLECRLGENRVTLACTGDAQPAVLDAPPVHATVLDAFCREVASGAPGEGTTQVLRSSRAALELQAFADQTKA